MMVNIIITGHPASLITFLVLLAHKKHVKTSIEISIYFSIRRNPVILLAEIFANHCFQTKRNDTTLYEKNTITLLRTDFIFYWKFMKLTVAGDL